MNAPTPDRLGCSDCERLRDGRVAQPVNTLTSAGYLPAGALVVARLGGPGAAHAGGARLYGGIMVLVGAGSVAFHGPQPRGAQLMHDLPIVALIGMSAVAPAVRAARGRDPLPGRSRRRALTAAGLSAAAVACYRAGRTGARTCAPDSWWQWHGAWHLLTAAGFTVAAELLFGSAEGRH
jgi:hypothetical protein